MTTPSVLLTGGTGFVGSHLAEALVVRGVAVRALVRASSHTAILERLGVATVAGSLEDGASLERAVRGVDAVIHLAALTHAPRESAYLGVNAEGTRTLVEAARSAGVPRFVYLSSLAAVGPSLHGRPVAPGDRPRPLTAYGRSKLAGEAALAEVAPWMARVVLRAPAVYGPREREMLRFFRLARIGIRPVPTGPPRLLQMIHVQDLARALVLAATVPDAEGVVHVADADARTFAELTELVARAVGRPGVRVPVPAGLIRVAAAVSEAAGRLRGGSTIFNRDKARELLAPGWLTETESARRVLGFETSIGLPEGLAATAAWYREHGWL
ncbi:MAG: NAD-dependent epimerase/dehydratase family protein [Gemmatimonadota bacterium]